MTRTPAQTAQIARRILLIGASIGAALLVTLCVVGLVTSNPPLSIIAGSVLVLVAVMTFTSASSITKRARAAAE